MSGKRDRDHTFRAIFRKELLEGFITRRFPAVLILCLIVFPVGSYMSRRDYQTRLQNFQEAQRLYESTKKTVGAILFQPGGAKAFRAPSGLSFLSTGLEIVLPDAAETVAKLNSSAAEMRLTNTQGLDNLYGFFHGPLDFSFLVTVVMTFLALAFSYNAVSGEKESGTLGLMLSNSVLRSRIVAAKAAAQFLMLAIPFLAGVALSLALAPPSAAAAGGASPWPAVLTAVAFSLLTIAAFFNLGLLVSSLTRQAVTSIVVLLLVWTALFAVVPRFSVIATRLLAPAPSEQVFGQEKARIRLANNKACEAEVDALIKANPIPRDRNTIAPERQKWTAEFQAKQDAIRAQYQSDLAAEIGRARQAFERKRDAQIRTSMLVSRISPVSCFVRPMAEIAGTGWLEYKRFAKAVDRFLGTLNDEIYSQNKITAVEGGGVISFGGRADDPAPRMPDIRIPFSDVARDVLPDFVLLLLFNALFFAGAFVAFLRYDPR
jgi:ABC-type transport system involved in multi-copper enzyme maturation permease subunit